MCRRVISVSIKILTQNIISGKISLSKNSPKYTVGGFTLCPRKGGDVMVYVTVNDMLTYTLVLINIIGLMITIFTLISRRK